MFLKKKIQGLHAALLGFEKLLVFSLSNHTVKSLMIWSSFEMSKWMPVVVGKLSLWKYLIILGMKPPVIEWYIFLNEILYLNLWYYMGGNVFIKNIMQRKYENNSKLLKHFDTPQLFLFIKYFCIHIDLHDYYCILY